MDAFYRFYLMYDKSSATYSMVPLEKMGNNKFMNQFFEERKDVKLKKIGPVDELGGYIGYTFSLSDNKRSVFQTGVGLLPFGIVRSEGLNDAVLFVLKESLEFEVYVFNERGSDGIYLFQQLKDGELIPLISEIKNRYKK